MRAVARKIPPLMATLLAVSFLTFLLTSLLPGDPAEQILGPQSATPERLAAVRADLRLDDRHEMDERVLCRLTATKVDDADVAALSKYLTGGADSVDPTLASLVPQNPL